MKGSKRQLTPTRSAPALAILTAHSPTPTPDSSPPGPMHIVAATGIPYSSATSMAHSISKMLRKYSQMIRSNTHSCCNWDPVLERHLDGPLHLQDVAEVLADDQVHLVQDQHLKGLSQLVLDFGLD